MSKIDSGATAPAATTERAPSYPIYFAPPTFCLRATECIQTPRRVIQPGELLHIDPTIPPAKGRMVVVGDRLELWAGQDDVRGVLVAIMTLEAEAEAEAEAEGGVA